MRLNLLPLVSKSRAGRSRLVKESRALPRGRISDFWKKILATPGDAERQQFPAATARESHPENMGLSDAAVEIFCEQWKETSLV